MGELKTQWDEKLFIGCPAEFNAESKAYVVRWMNLGEVHPDYEDRWSDILSDALEDDGEGGINDHEDFVQDLYFMYDRKYFHKCIVSVCYKYDRSLETLIEYERQLAIYEAEVAQLKKDVESSRSKELSDKSIAENRRKDAESLEEQREENRRLTEANSDLLAQLRGAQFFINMGVATIVVLGILFLWSR